MPMKYFFSQPFDRPSKDEQKRGQDCGNSQQAPVTQSANDAEHSANPTRRGRGQSSDVTHWIAQDHSGADEADTGQDSLDHSANGIQVC